MKTAFTEAFQAIFNPGAYTHCYSFGEGAPRPDRG